MSFRRRHLCLAALLLAATLLIAAPAGGDPADEPITVSLDRPAPFDPVWGEVTIEAIVVADEPIERVVFYVDGSVVGELREPPWHLTADLGEAVGEHRFDVVAHGASGATGAGGFTTPALRIDDEVAVDLEQLYVTVSRDGSRLLDLARDDFAVIDEGRRQQIVTFARGDIPFTAAALVDASVSMRGEKLAAALRGAKAFFDGMRPLDEGRLMVFSDRLLHATPFTTFADVLTTGLGGVEARGGTALRDHLYLALAQLEQRQGRRVVLLLSDGVDSHSVVSTADVARLARRSQALIYWLRLPYRAGRPAGDMPALTTAWRGMEDYRRGIEALERTVRESGGTVRPLASIDDIGPAFREILTELRQQYVLGYYPEPRHRDGRWRRVKVRVDRPGAEVRSRDGYLDL